VYPTCSLSLLYAQLPRPPKKGRRSQALKNRVLPHLTALITLSLDSVQQRVESCFLQHISTIASLREFKFKPSSVSSGVELRLPPLLTAGCADSWLC
jgi:hypothetical protein